MTTPDEPKGKIIGLNGQPLGVSEAPPEFTPAPDEANIITINIKLPGMPTFAWDRTLADLKGRRMNTVQFVSSPMTMRQVLCRGIDEFIKQSGERLVEKLGPQAQKRFRVFRRKK